MSNRLAVLAADIRAAHEDVGRASRQSAERAVDAGRWLAEAKEDEKIPRGGWARWAEEVAGVPARTARHYVQLFNAVSEGSATLPDIAEAGQIGALKAVAEKAKQAKKAEQAARIGEAWQDMPDAAARYTLVHGPLTELLTYPAESVDIVCTDPPYPRQFLPVFDQLGAVAAHLLRPGGLLLCMSGQVWLPEVYAAIGRHLDYHWTTAYLTPGGQAVQIFPRHVNTFWKPVLVYRKGEYSGDWFGDVTRSDVNDNDKEHHHWGQSESGMADLMRRFVRPGHVVVDPFLGGGTTAVVALDLGATFIGCDIDQAAINTTKMRLADADLVV